MQLRCIVASYVYMLSILLSIGLSLYVVSTLVTAPVAFTL